MNNRSLQFAVIAGLSLAAFALNAAPPQAMPFTATDIPVALVSEGTIRTSADLTHFRDVWLVTQIDSPQLGTLWTILEVNGNFDALGEGHAWGHFFLCAFDPMVAPDSVIGSGTWTGKRQYLGDSVWMTPIQFVCRLDSGHQMRADETILSWTPFPLPFVGMIEGVVWMPGVE